MIAVVVVVFSHLCLASENGKNICLQEKAHHSIQYTYLLVNKGEIDAYVIHMLSLCYIECVKR